MSSERQLVAALRARGDAMGLAAMGICTVEPFLDVARTMKRRVAAGTAGHLTFTYRNPEVATDVRSSFPWAERLIVGAATYLPQAGRPDPGPNGVEGRIARFAVEDFYPLIRRPLAEMADLLGSHGYRAEVLVDDNRLVDRAAAVRAGVGWWGKNSMVLAPGHGPWLLLGSVATDALLGVTPPMRRDCGRCEACLPACPTGALVAPGMLDVTRCIAYWAQAPGAIPRWLRSAMGNRVYGCDDCLEACPPGDRLLTRARSRRGMADLVSLLRASDEELLSTYGHFYIPRRQPRYLRRNALVALGNAKNPGHVSLLSEYLAHRDWLLRAHAAWALGETAGIRATGVLVERCSIETDQRVMTEIRSALDLNETMDMLRSS